MSSPFPARLAAAAFSFGSEQLVSHCVNHRHLDRAMDHSPLHTFNAAVLLQQLHGVNLAEAVRGHILS